ncbi:Protein phosphatase 1, regulatory subunit [Phytophthora cinnamomi]|uniref:Protein phosphatase 1, regulatory subunit n=1 Tax=Phytophthora cinnamomi TaxID=4785 RepID=UPI00355A6758|nr:Protein phosphatase 1, regulatory subunit [Phytophthora cinnamomi]
MSMAAPPPAPPAEPLGPVVASHVNAGVEFIDDLAADDERDELVEQLNLHGNSIQSMDGLESFAGLVELCLSSNYIEEVAFHALQPLVQLRVLDLSANSISSTLGFPQLPRLEELSMAHNCLRGLEGLTRPVKFPKLRYMDLRGNEIAEFDDLGALQRFKRLSHIRLQAANGDQANPICDLDDYHHVIIKMLPKLELLDEEEVDFLKEMGSLHMPKYRSLMRRIVENKRSEQHSRRSPQSIKQLQATSEHYGRDGGQPDRHPTNQRHHRPPRIQTDIDDQGAMGHRSRYAESEPKKAQPTHSPTGNQSPVLTTEGPDEGNQHSQQRLVVKDSGTNTDVDMEKDILKREFAIGQKETEFLEKEKAFLSKENEFHAKEQLMKSQIADLQDKLNAAEIRATKAEATLLEMSNHLLQKEKDQAAVTAASDESASAFQQSQSDQQREWDATLANLKASHQQALATLSTEKADLLDRIALLEADTTAITQKHREAEQLLQQKSIALERSESKADEVAGELELARKTHEATITRLSDEAKYHKDRSEQAEKRAVQLEKQVAELKINVETVYNKCIEKDDAIQQLKKSLSTRQDEIETLRLQHVKDTERQDKLQQQQQDLYERQLQASIIQVEMEFRKEYQQSVQKFQLLQRKNQERLKDIKKTTNKTFVEDAKRSDAFKAEIRGERAKRKELEQKLADEQMRSAQVASLHAELDGRDLEIHKLREEMQLLEEQRETWRKLEDDLRAALKVKDVMLADQLRQIQELTSERQQVEVQFNDEMNEYQTQIEDLEAALDESLQKVAEEEVKAEALNTKLAALEKDAPEKEKELSSLRADLEQKVSALEFLDQEMQRMRTVLENQDALFQKRMQKHLEQQREEVERVRAGADEEREHQLHGWETERGEMMHKYEVLAIEMENVAAHNGKLRVALDQERRKNAQNDRDMRILLAQIDRERQSKKENLRQIKSLFEQLQREAS